MQTDPIGYEDQMNLYAYVGNDPVNLVDPTGTGGIFFQFFDFGGADALARNQQALTNAGIAGANAPGDGANFGPTLGEKIVGNSSLVLFEASANAAANVAILGAAAAEPTPAGEALLISAARTAGANSTRGAAGAFQAADGTISIGLSSQAARSAGVTQTSNPAVRAVLDTAPEALARIPRHGKCCEPAALSAALNAGTTVRGGTIVATDVSTGAVIAPCPNCTNLLTRFGVSAIKP